MVTVRDLTLLAPVNESNGVITDLSAAPILALQNPVSLSGGGGQGGIPLLTGDQLYVWAFSNADGVAVTVNGRSVNAAGVPVPFTQSFFTPDAYNAGTMLQPLSAASLQAISVNANIASLGLYWCYVFAGIVNPAIGLTSPYLQLIGDYVGSVFGASWPGRGVKPPLEGPGLSYTKVLASPDPGAEYVATVPLGVTWDVHWLNISLTTSGAGGNRFINAIARFIDEDVWSATLNPPVGPSKTVNGQFDAYGEDYQNGGVVYRSPLPRQFTLTGCNDLHSENSGLDGADQYGTIYLGITERCNPDDVSCG